MNYDPTVEAKDKCAAGGRKDPVIAPLGRLGCDASVELTEYMMDLFTLENQNGVDYILLNGDLVGHKIAQDPGDDNQQMYELLKKTHVEVQQLFTKHFPSTPVFLTFGNNDCKYHDSGPFHKEKGEFLSFIFELWFKNHTPNAKYADAVRDSFMNGGYYKIDLGNMAIVSLNTLYFNSGQYQPEIGTQAADQMKWLDGIL